MTWPPRWSAGPHFKTGQTSVKVTRAKVRLDRKAKEEASMRKARKRDGNRCRMPMCDCKRFKLRLDVSHQVHRGIGGNPAGDRSDTSLLMTVCCARHKDHAVSIDKGTLRWIALTDQGANGPVKWEVQASAVLPRAHDRWIEIAREVQVQLVNVGLLTDTQRAILTILKEMTL